MAPPAGEHRTLPLARRPWADRRDFVRFPYIELYAFSADPDYARRVVDAGATGVVVDWERRGKRERQIGADTQVNADTPAQLAAVRDAAAGRVLCRVNGWGDWAPAEIDLAVRLGADEVLLPMVRRGDEVDGALDVVAGRCGLGILVETTDAVRQAEALLSRPVSRVYVGMNDLMIDRGRMCLFEALVDGTVDYLAAVAADAGIPFGMAGLTVPEGGRPIPCRLFAAALADAGASFTFLRRSFHADTAGRDLAVEVPRIRAAAVAARHRDASQVIADRAELEAMVALLSGDRAG
jgi:hypothetical protein